MHIDSLTVLGLHTVNHLEVGKILAEYRDSISIANLYLQVIAVATGTKKRIDIERTGWCYKRSTIALPSLLLR